MARIISPLIVGGGGGRIGISAAHANAVGNRRYFFKTPAC
jgi:hypothetical protein